MFLFIGTVFIRKDTEMATISRTSRLGRAVGARIYPGSAPAAHDHSRDRFIPTRQTPTEATAMMKNRLDVEIQRQELRRATRRALYPGVVLFSVLLLAAPVGVNSAVDAYEQQRAQEKAQAEREAERERLREERQAAADADAAPSEGDTSEPSGVLQPPTTTGPPDNPFESSQQPQFPPAPGSQGADAFGSSPFPAAPGSEAAQGGQQ